MNCLAFLVLTLQVIAAGAVAGLFALLLVGSTGAWWPVPVIVVGGALCAAIARDGDDGGGG